MKYPTAKCAECGQFLVKSRSNPSLAVCLSGCGRIVEPDGAVLPNAMSFDDAAKADAYPLAVKVGRRNRRLRLVCDGREWLYASDIELPPGSKTGEGNILAKVEFKHGFALRELEPLEDTPA